MQAGFLGPFKGMCIPGRSLMHFEQTGVDRCAELCREHPGCMSFDWWRWGGVCRLSAATHASASHAAISCPGGDYYEFQVRVQEVGIVATHITLTTTETAQLAGRTSEAAVFAEYITIPVVSVLVLISLALCTWILCFTRFRPRQSDAITGVPAMPWGAELPELPVEHIDMAMIESVFPTTTSSSMSECSICLVAMQDNDVCRKLQCGHEFHADCVSQWFMHCPVPRLPLRCPLCRHSQQLVTGSAASSVSSPLPSPESYAIAIAI